MRLVLIIASLFLFSCSGAMKDNTNEKKEMTFNEIEILEQLDLAFNGVPSKYYPKGQPEDIKYNFFLDLGHGYVATAGNRIHLYADTTRWIIVFEKSGYLNRANSAEIELDYIGNCINYPIDKYPERNYITNANNIILITSEELSRIENKDGEEMETFELIGHNIKEIKIRDQYIPFNNNYKDYERVGIKVRDYYNSKNLIGFEDLIRYLHETNPNLISATENEIRKYIPKDIPKLMTINEFRISTYEEANLPSQQETFKLIAKILKTRDIKNWKPTQKPNNSWKNWESGHL